MPWPDHLLTLDEWDALSEDDTLRRAELAEGVLHVSPSPAFGHQRAMFLLAQQLEAGSDGLPAVTVCDPGRPLGA